MDHTITPTWATVELPILRAIIQAETDNTDYTATARAAVPDIDDRHFRRAVAALAEDDYLDATVVPVAEENVPIRVVVRKPLPKTRRAVGQWPTADGLAAELAAAFDRAADVEDDVDRKLSYRSAAQAIVTGVATTAITKYMGL